jgi:hypothetical protein
MSLDRAPQEALALFDGYLANASGGTLEEEALAGRALALGRLGRASEEERAWALLIGKYPDSVYVPQAKARLGKGR